MLCQHMFCHKQLSQDFIRRIVLWEARQKVECVDIIKLTEVPLRKDRLHIFVVQKAYWRQILHSDDLLYLLNPAQGQPHILS